MRYCMIGVAGAAPIAFLTSTIFWLLAAFRPDRAPELTQLYNDLAWITFTCGIPFLVAECLFMAVAIYLDQQDRPVFARWVAYFNLLIAVALVPAGFAGLTLSGPFAWNGFLSFWVKNIAIALWIVVMAVVLGRSIPRDRTAAEATRMKRSAWRDNPKRELWLAWYATIAFYNLYTVVFFIVTRTQPPASPGTTPTRSPDGSLTITKACSSVSR